MGRDFSTSDLSCGLSYEASTSVNYDARGVLTSKLQIFTDLDT